MENYTNFYPTPKELLRKITSTVQWWKIDGILEPEAGKGDIADYIKSEHYDRAALKLIQNFRLHLKVKDIPLCMMISLLLYRNIITTLSS